MTNSKEQQIPKEELTQGMEGLELGAETNTPETAEQREGENKISKTREWVHGQYGKLAELLRSDAMLDEKMFEKLGPQIEGNRRQAIEEKHLATLRLIERTEETEKYYDNQLDELERLSSLRKENFKGITPEQFKVLPRMDKRVLVADGLIRQQIENNADVEPLIGWYKTGEAYGQEYVKLIDEKMLEQARAYLGSPKEKDPWSLLQHEPYSRYKWATGKNNERNEVMFSDEANGRMTPEVAKKYFEESFENNTYTGDPEMIGSYLRNVPQEEQNTDLITKAKNDLVESRWSIHEGNEEFKEIMDELTNPDSSTALVLQTLWSGEDDFNAFSDERQYKAKNTVTFNRLKEILTSPERGKNYLNYFVKDCGIRNIDRFTTTVLDKVYAEKDNKEKPYGLMLLSRADHNQAFFRPQVFEDFTKSVENSGERLLIAEASNDREVMQAIKAAATRQGKKIDFMLIGGHGTPDDIQFGSPGFINKNYPARSAYVDKDKPEHIQMTMRTAKKYVEPQAEVLALACSSGAKTRKVSYSIAESTAQRTGWITKGLSKPLSIIGLNARRKENGRVGLDMKVFDAPDKEGEGKFAGVPGEVNTYDFKRFEAE